MFNVIGFIILCLIAIIVISIMDIINYFRNKHKLDCPDCKEPTKYKRDIKEYVCPSCKESYIIAEDGTIIKMW